MVTGTAGKNLILEIEGFISPARVLKGETYPTYGYGHMGKDVKVGMVISKTDAMKLFEKDLHQYEVPVNGIRVPLNQNEYDALVSFSYNEGAYALPKSTLARKLNAGDRKGASEEFKNWTASEGGEIYRQGLLNRRMKEKALFLKPVAKAPVTTYHDWPAIAAADAKKKADAKALKDQQDKLKQANEKKALADSAAVKKAKLTKDAQAVKKAEATKKANDLKAKQATATLNKNAENLKKQNEANLKNAHGTVDKSKNTPATPKAGVIKTLPSSLVDLSKTKISKSGISIVGLAVMVLLLANIKVPQTELE
jgi:lysozyme